MNGIGYRQGNSGYRKNCAHLAIYQSYILLFRKSKQHCVNNCVPVEPDLPERNR